MSPDFHWRRFLGTTLGVAVALSLLAFTLMVLVDPHDNFSISLPIKRAPTNANQRFSYPTIARSQNYDSVVLGTSTVRLLKPRMLNEKFGGRFANLAMNSGTAYEQSRILDLFQRHHEMIRTVIIGIDVVWCETGDAYQKYTHREFPEWLYDDDPWNDYLHVFNGVTLEESIRQLQFVLGRREPKFGFDGYKTFMPDPAEYDLEKARRNLYGENGVRPKFTPGKPYIASREERASWNFPTHEVLASALRSLPAETLKLVFFVPYHHFLQPAPGTKEAARWQECKRRITNLTSLVPNSHVLDFMIESEITRFDENYWDSLHYTVEIADRIVALLAEGVRTHRDKPELYRYLSTGAPAPQDSH